MKRIVLAIAVILSVQTVLATGNPVSNEGDAEITFIKDRKQLPDKYYQHDLRKSSVWQDFIDRNGAWYVHFNETNAKPHRAYGKPIQTTGTTLEDRAMNFIQQEMSGFGIPADLKHQGTTTTSKHHWVYYEQEYQGLEVLWSRIMVKMTKSDMRVISFGTDVFTDIDISTSATVTPTSAMQLAQAGINENILNVEVAPDLAILPIPNGHKNEHKLVYIVTVHGEDGYGVPSRYFTLVDAHSGDLHYRTNLVKHCGHEGCEGHVTDPGKLPEPASDNTSKMSMAGNIEVYIEADYYPEHNYSTVTGRPLPNLDITINGNTYNTDTNGYVMTSETGPATGTITLSGPWSTVDNNGSNPNFSTTLNGGLNNIDFNSDALIQERSAYIHVNDIHDHMKAYLPTFTGMDFSLPTNVDLSSGTCNAFYNGTSINFYQDGGGCYTYANVADVVYHEYGHGINDNFYQDGGSFFQNGAMGEGYADFWGYSLTLNPILGAGADMSDPNAFIRRYDIDPKVYPIDIVGEVHADGEIIAGAWYDTYVLLGNDMPLTLQLFADAYAGFQAATANGNEGQAFTDALIDVLQADDNDGDITNGTPNGMAIVQAFDIHGISLISNAELSHTPVESEVENTPVTISTDLQLTFPYTQYLGDVTLHYMVDNNPTVNDVPMSNTTGNTYEAQIAGQPEGTLITYWISTSDIFGTTAAVEPIGAADADPNLPYYTLVGYDLMGTDDVGDFNSDFGSWTAGLASDNATTGMWELAIPIGSFGTPGDPSTMVQPDYQHTPNGDICFVTENANSASDPIGTSDVDGGTTTLLSPIFDLSAYVNPAFTYWRWYTNNPPSGANPNADWWQAYISDDGGNTWVPIEDTKVSERNWRRKAFRVADYVNLTSQVQMKFNVSDSIRAGQNLDGGSLVEGALDDIQLWERAGNVSVEENVVFNGVAVYPNPVLDNAKVNMNLAQGTNVELIVYNEVGQIVYRRNLGDVPAGHTVVDVPLSDVAPGIYHMELRADEDTMVRKLSIIH